MTDITVEAKLSDDQCGAAWRLYEAAFADLDTVTVQRHLMLRHEFDEVARDGRVDKYLAHTDGGVLCGLATYTNDLYAMPLISPRYFARRFPQHFADRRIWYCGFVAVAPGHEGVFAAMVEAMYSVADREGGIISLDYCRRNVDRGLPRAVRIMLHRVSGGRVQCEAADHQEFWIYDTAPEVAG